MRILLTNDDGIAAPGICAAAERLKNVADLLILAPDRDRSGEAARLSLGRNLTVTRIDDYDVPAYSCSGTPVDCVRLVRLGFYDGIIPDLVISGINSTENLGESVTYSATVAAAMEATRMGVAGVAVSLCQSRPHRISGAKPIENQYVYLANLIAQLALGLNIEDLAAPCVLNVNGPNMTSYGGIEFTALAERRITDELIVLRRDDRFSVVDIYNSEPDYLACPGTDVNAVERGLMSVTPLQISAISLSPEAWAERLEGTLLYGPAQQPAV